MLLIVVGAVSRPPSLHAYSRVGLPVTQLPQTHAYQRVLRDFMAGLTADDLQVEALPFQAPDEPDDDRRYRYWLLLQQSPGLSAARMPADAFTLERLESEPGILLPADPLNCQSLAWLANWDDPGNPYFENRALKRRAAILAAVDMIMLDHLYATDPRGAARSDYLGGNLIWIGYTYGIVKDSLPAPVQAAFEAGLRRLVIDYLDAWGPTGAMTDMDLFAPVGLGYIIRAVDDPDLHAVAHAYARRLFSDHAFYHPAGYFVDNDCFDTSYNGISLYFGVWAALMNHWPEARKAIEDAYRLRAHLCFPAPDGQVSGPSAMSSRTSGDPHRDQWQFPTRIQGAAMIAQEAVHLAIAQLPTAAVLAEAPTRLMALMTRRMADEIPAAPQPWREGHWSRQLNFAFDFYQPGHHARLRRMQRDAWPPVKPLYQRDEPFVRAFDEAFVIARLGRAAWAIHTGPVGRPVGHGGRPYGFGGGALAAYWTPETGAAVVTRRRGVQGAVFDTYEEWRQWPIHAVSGLTADDELVSSSRIRRPETERDLEQDRWRIRVAGSMPKYNPTRTATGPSGLAYERVFSFIPDALTIRTTIRSDGAESLAELYETIPVLLAETTEPPTTIAFGVGDGPWIEASEDGVPGVTRIRLSRFEGAVDIRFKSPQSVRLAPGVWRDGYQTRAQCRTILIDLLGDRPRPAGIDSLSVTYTMTPEPLPKP